ncbi:tape measure protein [Acinetobacter indicus]|uniref:tape measure protein n=1 Tax=Acinetobacter indicus TaxID=756892 RepID=UPI00257500BD|nr:tape measure protein [Acinetobacter indicus]
MSKNLTFKLVMDADTKNFVSNVKQSEKTINEAFKAIKDGNAEFVADAKAASDALSNLVPTDTKQKVGQLVSELHNATAALDSLGDDATVSAENLKQLGDYGAAALESLQNHLKQAKLHLNYLSATNATPEDIDNAQREVKELETGVKQVKTAFDAYKTTADAAAAASADASKEIGGIIPKGSSELADKLAQSLTAAKGIIKDAGDDAKTAAGNFTDFGNKAEKALAQLKNDLALAKQNLEAFSKTNASPADIEVAKRQVDQLEKEVQQADQAFNGFQSEVNRANTQLKETDTAAQSAQKGIGALKSGYTALIGVMGGIGIGLGLRELAEAADSYTNLSTRIQIATKDGGDFGSAMAGVHQVALATNSSLQATGDLFTRLNTVGKEMGMTQQQALDLTQTVTQAIQIGGGSAQASEAAITQFIQAMQGGVLRGEEFNSIMENGFGLAEALAKGLGVTTGELRKMAENGELSAERVVKAIQSQAAQVQSTYDQFPATIGNALQRIQTRWQTLIGTMDQANGASATVADWLAMIADNMGIVEVLIEDLGEGFVWVGDQLKKIDPSVWVSLKDALSSAYDAIKDVVSTLFDLGKTVADILSTSLTAALSVFSSFTGEVTEAGEQVSALERIFQGLSIAFGFISDSATAIKIGVNLLTGAFFDLAGAANSVLAALTWGDVSKQFAANADLMKQKAKEYYAEADKDAQDFHSKGLQRLDEASKTQAEKDAETVASSKAKLEQLLADQTAEVEGKKVSEQEKLKAVQAYAEASIKANGGVMDGTMQAELMTKGYIVTMNDVGKVSVEAWNAAAEGAEKNANASVKARKAAESLKLDLYELKNGVTETFNTGAKNVNNFAAGVEELGFKGKAAGEAVYQAWLKWLETAKSQNEVDMAMLKLQEFGKTGQLSTKQVEMGMLAVRSVVQELPADLDPVEQAFERLGIKTKEQLKLAAQSALADFNTIQASGQATAEGIKQAYDRAMQAATASGDQAVIAAAQAKAASLGLRIEIDDTGKASVKAMDELTEANHRVRDSARRIGDGYREAGKIARDEANAAQQAWNKAVAESAKKWDAEMKRQGEGLSAAISGYESYSKNDVIAQIKSMGYSDSEAKKLAGSIWSQGLSADRDAKFAAYGKGGNLAVNKLIEQEFNNAAAKGLTTQHGTNKINELLRNLDVRSTGSVPKVNDYAPSISYPSFSDSSSSSPKTATYELIANGQSVMLQGSANDQSTLEQILGQLGQLKRTT